MIVFVEGGDMEEEQGGRQTVVDDGYKRAPNDDAGHTGLFDLQKRCGPCSIRGSMRAWARKGYELRRAAAGKWLARPYVAVVEGAGPHNRHAQCWVSRSQTESNHDAVMTAAAHCPYRPASTQPRRPAIKGEGPIAPGTCGRQRGFSSSSARNSRAGELGVLGGGRPCGR